MHNIQYFLDKFTPELVYIAHARSGKITYKHKIYKSAENHLEQISDNIKNYYKLNGINNDKEIDTAINQVINQEYTKHKKIIQRNVYDVNDYAFSLELPDV